MSALKKIYNLKNNVSWYFTSADHLLKICYTYLFLLLVEIVNNNTNEEVECEERAKDDEDDKVQVHVEVDLIRRLFLYLKRTNI